MVWNLGNVCGWRGEVSSASMAAAGHTLASTVSILSLDWTARSVCGGENRLWQVRRETSHHLSHSHLLCTGDWAHLRMQEAFSVTFLGWFGQVDQ